MENLISRVLESCLALVFFARRWAPEPSKAAPARESAAQIKSQSQTPLRFRPSCGHLLVPSSGCCWMGCMQCSNYFILVFQLSVVALWLAKTCFLFFLSGGCGGRRPPSKIDRSIDHAGSRPAVPLAKLRGVWGAAAPQQDCLQPLKKKMKARGQARVHLHLHLNLHLHPQPQPHLHLHIHLPLCAYVTHM